MSGRHRKPTNTGRTVAKVAMTSAMVGGAGVALAGHAAAASDQDWDKLAQCESSGNWSINSGNGFKGGLQFTPSTWASFGGTQYASSPEHASREQQMAVAEKVLAAQGWGAWPSCSSKLGLSSAATERTVPATPSSPQWVAPQQGAPHQQQAAPQQQADGTQAVLQTVDQAVAAAQHAGVQVPQQAIDALNAFKASGNKLDPSVVNFVESNKNVLPH